MFVCLFVCLFVSLFLWLLLFGCFCSCSVCCIGKRMHPPQSTHGDCIRKIGKFSCSRLTGGLLLEPLRCVAPHGRTKHSDRSDSGRCSGCSVSSAFSYTFEGWSSSGPATFFYEAAGSSGRFRPPRGLQVSLETVPARG